MIQSTEDYLFYLESDRISLNIQRKKPFIFGHEIWVYQRLLRKVEYLTNCKKGIFTKLFLLYYRYRLRQYEIRLGFWIGINICEAGLNLAHFGNIVIGAKKIGENCRIHSGVNIGVGAGGTSRDDGPIIGNNVYIGPGAKIFGPIFIADDIAIGANAVVNKSFNEPGITIAGIPAKKISDKGSDGLLIKGTEIIRNEKK